MLVKWDVCMQTRMAWFRLWNFQLCPTVRAEGISYNTLDVGRITYSGPQDWNIPLVFIRDVKSGTEDELTALLPMNECTGSFEVLGWTSPKHQTTTVCMSFLYHPYSQQC